MFPSEFLQTHSSVVSDWSKMDLLLYVIASSLVVAISLFSFIYKFYQNKYDYWKRRGVPGPQPSIPFGNFPSMFTRHISEPIVKLYDEYKHLPFYGIYSLWYPILIVTDLELIKHIMIKDAWKFSSHGWYANEKVEPLSAHLVSMHGKEWQDLRAKFSPAFSSGKTKMLYSSMMKVADKFSTYICDKTSRTNILDFKTEMCLFTSENISDSVFGLETNSFTNGFNTISQYAIQFFVPANFFRRIMLVLTVLAPKLLKKFNLKIFSKTITDFFVTLVENTVAMREKTSTERNDFMQILMQMNKNQLKDDQGNLIDQKGVQLTTEQMAAQAFLFFLAGFETSSSASSFTLHELAIHPELQDKVREEILETLERHDGICTYEAINEMKYLYAVVEETLRLYPPLNLVFRECTGDFKIPGTDIVIEKGTQVFIPNISLHKDPQYFENPEIYDPDRFMPENKEKILPCTYMPFGEGPRICIGQKFGMVQSMLALVMILKDYEVSPCEKTKIPVEVGVSPINTEPHDVWLKVTKVNIIMRANI